MKRRLVLCALSAVSICFVLSSCALSKAPDNSSKSSMKSGIGESINGFTQEITKSVSNAVNSSADKRFFTVPGAGYGLNAGTLIIDRDTGVIYLFYSPDFRGSSGLTPLIDADGKPILYEGATRTEEDAP